MTVVTGKFVLKCRIKEYDKFQRKKWYSRFFCYLCHVIFCLLVMFAAPR